MAMNTLTALQVKNAQPAIKDGKQIPKLYSDGGGLYLRVTPSSKSWVFKFKHLKKPREMGIGTLAEFSLADAREQAAALRKQVAQGIDPIEQRQAAKAAAAQAAEAMKIEEARKGMTFAAAANAYVDAHAPGWKNPKHVEQWRNTLTTYCAGFGDKPVGEVTVDDVEAALRPIWLSKTETATRLLQRIVLVAVYAHDKGWRQSDDAEGWPMRLRRRLPALPKKTQRVRHHPALPYGQLPAFMAALRKSPAMGSRALEFAILNASRSGEVRLATWQEFDLDAALWTIPASRMKAGEEHRVPLSRQAVELLRELPKGEPGDLVFPGERKGRPLSDMTLNAFIKRQNAKAALWVDDAGETVTQHGFRSTFSDWTSECTPFPADVREMALAHTIGNKVEAAYRRGDLFEKRRALMQAWADYVDGVKGANVLEFKAA